MITLSSFHTQDGQWSRKKSRKVIFIIGTITFNLQSHGHKNDKQFSPGPTPGREHQHTFNATSNSISSMIWIAPTAMARWSMQRHRKYQVSWPTLSSNKVTTHRSWCWCLYHLLIKENWLFVALAFFFLQFYRTRVRFFPNTIITWPCPLSNSLNPCRWCFDVNTGASHFGNTFKTSGKNIGQFSKEYDLYFAQ